MQSLTTWLAIRGPRLAGFLLRRQYWLVPKMRRSPTETEDPDDANTSLDSVLWLQPCLGNIHD